MHTPRTKTQRQIVASIPYTERFTNMNHCPRSILYAADILQNLYMTPSPPVPPFRSRSPCSTSRPRGSQPGSAGSAAGASSGSSGAGRCAYLQPGIPGPPALGHGCLKLRSGTCLSVLRRRSLGHSLELWGDMSCGLHC